MQWSGSDPYYESFTFDCPHCRKQRLAAHFTPPIDPAGLRAKYGWPETLTQGRLKWKRTGETFETLTLEPSLDFSASGHFHGSIHNGEVSFA